MNQEIVIIGASGHGSVVADIVLANKDRIVGFLDDDLSKKSLGVIERFTDYPNAKFVIAIGDAKKREEIANRLNCRWYTAIHPSAIISPSAAIGEGTVIMPNAVVNANAEIGAHCIINTTAVIEHDNVIEDFSHISVGAKLGGGVTIGKSSWIGIGASVNNNITVCDNCTIGAGAVVVRDINEAGTYIGVPAKKMIK